MGTKEEAEFYGLGPDAIGLPHKVTMERFKQDASTGRTTKVATGSWRYCLALQPAGMWPRAMTAPAALSVLDSVARARKRMRPGSTP